MPWRGMATGVARCAVAAAAPGVPAAVGVPAPPVPGVAAAPPTGVAPGVTGGGWGFGFGRRSPIACKAVMYSKHQRYTNTKRTMNTKERRVREGGKGYLRPTSFVFPPPRHVLWTAFL